MVSELDFVRENPFTFEVGTRQLVAYIRVEEGQEFITVGARLVSPEDDTSRMAASLADACASLLRLATEFAACGVPEGWPFVRALAQYHLAAQDATKQPLVIDLPPTFWH